MHFYMNALCKIADIAVQNLLKKVQDKVQKDVLAAEDFMDDGSKI